MKASYQDTQADENAPLSQEEQLESLLFQFVNLYERWSEDRQVAAKQGSDLAKVLKAFSDEIERFSDIREDVKRTLISLLSSHTDRVSKHLEGALLKALEKGSDSALTRLKEASFKAESLLTDYHDSLKISRWKMMGVSFLSSVIASLLIVKLLIPAPTLPLTEQQITSMAMGRLTNKIFYQLSEEEQRHWLNVAEKAMLSLKQEKQY